MEEKKDVTLTEALEITVNILNGISVPISMTKQIAMPISSAIQNLIECIQAVKKNEKPKDDDFEIVDAGQVDELPPDANVVEMK